MNDHIIELTDQELSRVSAGFLGLLGLIGPIAGIAGQVLGGIGKKKSQEAEQITKDAAGGQGQGQGGQSQGQGSGQAPTRGAGNLLGERAPVRQSDGS